MGFKRKRSVALTIWWHKRKEANKNMLLQLAASAAPPVPAESTPEPQLELEMFVEAETACKQEPPEAGENEPMPLHLDEIKVEVDFLDPKESSLVEEMIDPVGQDPVKKLFPKKEKTRNKNQQQNRCQFCLKQFRMGGKFVAIAKSRIEFVLGLSDWGTPGTRTYGCKNCRKMFEKFYEFKQSCFQALERSTEILPWIGANKKAEKSVDSKSKKKKAKQMQSEPSRHETKDVPQTEEFDRLENGSTLPYETAEEAIVPERSTELPISDDDSNISELEPVPLHDEPVDKTEKRMYCCCRCRKDFPTETIYLNHKPSCFKANPLPEPLIPCSLCPRKFRTQWHLACHINKHNGVRTIPCRREGCNKMFFSPGIRHNHEKICGQSAQFICNVCGSLFTTDTNLRTHLATHEDPKFSCDLCSKAFHKKAHLKKHAATHSDERNFQCKVCDKRFKSAEANRVHQRIHTQEKPYGCNICGQRFTYNCLLKTHLEKGH